MQKSKIYIGPNILDKISSSNKLTDKEKITSLRYIYYMTEDEKIEFTQLV